MDNVQKYNIFKENGPYIFGLLMRETKFHTRSVQETELQFRTFQHMRLYTAG
jgi:hypothetical protein